MSTLMVDHLTKLVNLDYRGIKQYEFGIAQL